MVDLIEDYMINFVIWRILPLHLTRGVDVEVLTSFSCRFKIYIAYLGIYYYC